MRVNSTLLGRYCILDGGVTLPSATDPKPRCDVPSSHAVRNQLASSFPGKLVVFFSAAEWLYQDANTKLWDWRPHTNSSGRENSFVMMMSNVTPEFLAHEFGHYFWLKHPFNDTSARLYKKLDEVIEAIKLRVGVRRAADAVIGGKVNRAPVESYCSEGYGVFEGDGLDSTPPDPGPDVFRDAGLDPCNPADGTLAFTVSFPKGEPCEYSFTPDRYNIMNYWDKKATCLNHAPTITQEQINLVRASIDSGDRHHLLNYNPFVPMSFSIANANSGKLLAVAGMSTSPGAQVVQFYDNTTPDQRWQLEAAGSGYSTIRNVNSQMVLAVTGESTAAGATVVQWNFNGTPDQHWKLTDVGDGSAHIVNSNSQMVAAVEGMSTDDKARIVQWPYNATTDQNWVLVPQGRVRIQNVNSEKVLAVSKMSTNNGANVVQYSGNGTSDQHWIFVPDRFGYFRIRNVNSGKVLAVTDMSSADAALIVQYDDNGTTDHLWRLRYDTVTGEFRIQNYNGKVLAVAGMSKDDNANIVQYDDNGTRDHLWRLR